MKFLTALTAAVPLLIGGALTGTAAFAQGPSGYYVAVPATAAAKPSFVTRTAAWRLQNGAFVAAQAPERPQVLCELVVQRTGALQSFSVQGKAYDADQLAKCNAKAKRAGTDTPPNSGTVAR